MNKPVNIAEVEKSLDLSPAEQLKSPESASNFSPARRSDPRPVILARAAASLDLVEAGAVDLDEAFDGLVCSLSCQYSREMLERWERDNPPHLQKRRAA
jgi:hypothetical protein